MWEKSSQFQCSRIQKRLSEVNAKKIINKDTGTILHRLRNCDNITTTKIFSFILNQDSPFERIQSMHCWNVAAQDFI